MQALANTPKLLPPELKSMNVLIQEAFLEREISESEAYQEGEIPMYVLTNIMHFNGAAAMLYSDIISDFAEELETDFYILPSSIHEVILIPKVPDLEKQVLEQMVREVNQEEVDQQERLSDQVYCYWRGSGEFTV